VIRPFDGFVNKDSVENKTHVHCSFL